MEDDVLGDKAGDPALEGGTSCSSRYSLKGQQPVEDPRESAGNE